MFGTRKIGTLILLFMLATTFLLIPNSIIDTSNAAPQSGFFEGDVPIHGAYLQTINCDPRNAFDDDGDGVLDAGFMGQYVENPLIVDLEANGFYEGDKIMISHKQSIYNVLTTQVWYFNLFGLFSSSSDLLTDNWEYRPSSGEGDKWPIVGPENRVPGAIDVALGDYEHPTSGVGDNTNTWKQGREVENDIPEDFQIQGHLQFNEGKNGEQWTQKTYAFNNWFWVTIPPGAKYLFFQVVSFWSLSHDGYCRVTIDKDSDGDSIPDSWEIQGKIDFNKDDTTDLILPDADFEHKDLYVEIDYMGVGDGCPGHQPDAGALSDVITAFNKAPRDSVKNPDSSEGINLHINMADADEVPHIVTLRPWDDFYNIKSNHFGTEAQRNDTNNKWVLLTKKYVYRYCLFIHQQGEWNGTHWITTTFSGLAESWKGCDDFLVSLGGWTTNPGTRDEQAATFMHELGHALGLGHGGNDTINFKPNYLSIMNYMFTNSWRLGDRPLDYSRLKLDTIDESELDELAGFGLNRIETYSQPWYQTGFSVWDPGVTPHPDKFQITLLMPIDWNNDTSIDYDVTANVNHFPRWSHGSPAGEKLEGYDDWKNLKFFFQESNHFAKGALPEEKMDEITWEIAQEIKEAWNQFDPLPIPKPDPSDLPSEPEDDETSTDILPIIGIVAVVVAAILLIVFLFLQRGKKTTEKS